MSLIKERKAVTNPTNLHSYLTDGLRTGVIDYRLRVLTNPDGKLDFYIHPDGRDGETGDFEVIGNAVVPLDVGAGSGRTRSITEDDEDLGRQLGELIGAVALYLGELGPSHEGDKDRLRRALQRATRSRAHIGYMESH